MNKIDFIVHRNKLITKCPFSLKKVGSSACLNCKYFIKEESYTCFDDGGEGTILCSKTKKGVSNNLKYEED